MLGQSFTSYCLIKLWSRTIPSFIDHLRATVLPANLLYLMSGQSFLTQKNWVLTQKRPDSKYTGLSRHTEARQVVNKTLYCSGPEFNTLTVAIKNNSIHPWRRQKGYFSPNFKLSLLLEAMDL